MTAAEKRGDMIERQESVQFNNELAPLWWMTRGLGFIDDQ